MKTLRDEQQCRCGMVSNSWLKSICVRIGSRMVEISFYVSFQMSF